MTIKDQISEIQAALTEWHKSVGGACRIANDEPHLFTILGDAPGVPRTGILFDEEVPRNLDGSDYSNRVDRKIIVAVSRGRGFNLNLGDSLTKGEMADGKPMFVLVEEEAREVLPTLRFDGDEALPYYLGSKRLQFQGVTTDAYAVMIGTVADIPAQADNTDE